MLHWRTGMPRGGPVTWWGRLFGWLRRPPPPRTAFSAGHFYSPVVDPTHSAVAAPERWPGPETLPGLDLRDDSQRELASAALALAGADFAYGTDSNDSELDSRVYFTGNSQFGALDARLLFGLLRLWSPKRVIEVGSGFSSLIMADVNQRFLDGRCQITCIEPYPRPFLASRLPGISALIAQPVQSVPVETFLALEPGDILFIDSSHVAKTGSDVVHLLLEVLPRLKAGVRIHIHDIFLPHDYPKAWVLDENRSWNEQYLLRALLTHSSAFRVLLGAHRLAYRHPDVIRHALRLSLDAPIEGGGSFWIERGNEAENGGP